MSSSGEEDHNDNPPPLSVASNAAVPENKKRKVPRACDICRRKKIRCDGSQMPGNICSNCATSCLKCTYADPPKKRRPPKGYVEGLAQRLGNMEKLLQKVCYPDTDISHMLGGGHADRGTWQIDDMDAARSMLTTDTTKEISQGHTTPPIEDPGPSDDEDIVTLHLCQSFDSMNLRTAGSVRFLGKSSGITFIRKAIDLKREAVGNGGFRERLFRSIDEWFPWELTARHTKESGYMFPDEDLGMMLVDLYFEHVNALTPLLHRPTFDRKIAHGEHLCNSSFGAVYLLVCAVASRFSDDPRVLLDNVESKGLEYSSGWKFFQQIQTIRNSLEPPSLEDLQKICLSVLFLQGTSAMHTSWSIIGLGIRFAQDAGAHRRKSYNGKISVEGELWRRAFWVILFLDRQLSTICGRTSAIQDEDFDVEYPIDCDDEYWEHPDPQQAFKQPSGRPSKISFFISCIKLQNIMSFAHRTIYSINKSKILLGFVGQKWEQRIVAELDSSLNKWIDDVPYHLRWNSMQDNNRLFILQSCTLHAYYYRVQIFVHQPFIRPPYEPSPTCAFAAAIILLLDVWGGKQWTISIDPTKIADVYKCMTILKPHESRWVPAGRLWDILYELTSTRDLPQSSPHRGRPERNDVGGGSTPSSPPASMRRDNAATLPYDIHSEALQQHPTFLQQQSTPPQPLVQIYTLPMHSSDLGQHPLHGQEFVTATAGTLLAGVQSMSSESTSMPMTSSFQEPTNLAATGPTARHGYEHGGHGFGEAYSIDQLFLDQSLTPPYAEFSAAQQCLTHDHGASVGEPHAHTTGFTDAAGVLGGGGGASSRMMTSLALDAGDISGMPVWLNATTAFGTASDWDAYLSNMSGMDHHH